jgi:hypothetical protein
MTAPKLPGYTCPSIDKLKKRIQEAERIARLTSSDEAADLQAALKDIAHELSGEADVLEDLRSDNIQLRACAEYWQAEAERLESENN